MSLPNSLRLFTRFGIRCKSRLPISLETTIVLLRQPGNYLRISRPFGCADFSCINNLTHPQSSTLRVFSTEASNNDNQHKSDLKELTVFQRFKTAYKEHPKILLAVHIVTSFMWFGGFYVLVRSGIDLLPLLGASDAIQSDYSTASAAGAAAILSGLTKPVRYMFTLAATQQVIKYLRRIGYLAPLKPENKLRNLAKESVSKTNIRAKKM